MTCEKRKREKKVTVPFSRQLDPAGAVEGAMSGRINWIEGPEIVDVSPPGGPDTPWGASGQASGSSASLRPFG